MAQKFSHAISLSGDSVIDKITHLALKLTVIEDCTSILTRTYPPQPENPNLSD